MSLIVKSQYNRQTLSLIQESDEIIDSNRYPIVFSEAEARGIDKDHFLTILSNSLRSPLELSGLHEQEAPPTLLKIHQEFIEKKTYYKQRLMECARQDLNELERLNKKWRRYSPAPVAILTTCVVFMILTNPATAPAGLALSTIKAGAVVGGIARGAYEKSNDDAHVIKEASAQRRRWLIEIDTSEKRRLNDIRESFVERSKILVEHLNSLINEGEIDNGGSKKRRQKKIE